jgi:hypothetical protein
MSYTVRPLTFKPYRLEGLSDRLLISHYENNYGGAVRRLNALEGSSRQPGRRSPYSNPTALGRSSRSGPSGRTEASHVSRCQTVSCCWLRGRCCRM